MNFIAANGVMARPVDEPGAHELRLRVLSALVLGPIALAAVYVGAPYFETLLTVAALVMTWEWDRLCGGGRFAGSGYVLALFMLLTMIAETSGHHEVGLVIVVVGAFAVYAAARAGHRAEPAWSALGAIAIGLPCATLVWMRYDPVIGLTGVFWLIGAVWVTDVSGYVFGRMIGGPRLAPAISPGKTWAGLIGAVVMTALWSLGWTLWAKIDEPLLVVAVLGGIAAVVAQCGDLAVSIVKRRFGAKDASNVIPGHGGMLDRFDGMIAAAPAASVLVLLKTGGIFSW